MRKILVGILVLLSTLTVAAQPRTGYFVESFTLNHRMNPSFAPRQGYVGIPILSNIDLNINSNLGASTLLYPLDNGKLGLFLHPEVTSDEFLGQLSKQNYLDAVVGLDVINVGFYTGKSSFWTLDAGVNIAVKTSLPYELFQFLKEGMNGKQELYQMDNLGAAADVYGYVSLGYSSNLDKLVKGLRIGAKAKFLVGMMNVYAKYETLNLSMSSQKWSVSGIGAGRILGGGLNFTYDSETGAVNGIELDPSALGVGGLGAAFDFGIQYRISEGCILDGLRFSAAVLDLGFISYYADKATFVKSDGAVEYNGFENITDGEAAINEQLDDLLNRAMGLVTFKKQESEGDQMVYLSTKVNAGIDYTFLKNKMNVGILYSGAYSKLRDKHEFMVSFNYAPKDWFDVALSYSFMNTRSSLGWLLTFTPNNGMNFFIGSDYTAFKFTPQGIPVDKAFIGLNLGMSVPIGGKRAR